MLTLFASLQVAVTLAFGIVEPISPDVRLAAAGGQAFPAVALLEQWHASGHLSGAMPVGEDARRLASLVDDLNAAHMHLQWVLHESMEAVARRRIGEGLLLPVGGVESVVPHGVLSRHVAAVGGEVYVVDVVPGEETTVDLVAAELSALRADGMAAIVALFGQGAQLDLPQYASESSSEDDGSKQDDLWEEPEGCEFTSSTSVTTDPPPACVRAWGVTYSMDTSGCNHPLQVCFGRVTASIQQDPANPCTSRGIVASSTTNPATGVQGGAKTWDVTDSESTSILLNCGDEMTYTFSADGVELGTIVMTCAACEE